MKRMVSMLLAAAMLLSLAACQAPGNAPASTGAPEQSTQAPATEPAGTTATVPETEAP